MCVGFSSLDTQSLLILQWRRASMNIYHVLFMHIPLNAWVSSPPTYTQTQRHTESVTGELVGEFNNERASDSISMTKGFQSRRTHLRTIHSPHRFSAGLLDGGSIVRAICKFVVRNTHPVRYIGIILLRLNGWQLF